ncbi:MarR family winged helix-turn-helix transcriptional regulator [Halobacillus sp. Marseille-Q1614]|uniref:MarR family winged helix-turn-helix transcriptional regulator n=1 Tax=Halobacillus sp. Marseille-Q1614 TaxID=2709134 RepID=UPI00156FED49|nr:MarR family transcriptional regulator [Halobacillus sp. Marseille-Q1614]
MIDKDKLALITDLEGIFRTFIRGYRRDLNARLGEGFTSSELAFLGAIKENIEQNVSKLASGLNVSNSHATSIMNRLVEKELITRTRSRQDRRVVVFELTTQGKEVYSHLNEKRAQYMQERFEKLSSSDIKELIRIFHSLEQKK